MARPSVTHDGFLIPNARAWPSRSWPSLTRSTSTPWRTLAGASSRAARSTRRRPRRWPSAPGRPSSTASSSAVAWRQRSRCRRRGQRSVRAHRRRRRGVRQASTRRRGLRRPGVPRPQGRPRRCWRRCTATPRRRASPTTSWTSASCCPTSLLTKIAPTAELIRNVNGTANHYLVTGRRAARRGRRTP